MRKNMYKANKRRKSEYITTTKMIIIIWMFYECLKYFRIWSKNIKREKFLVDMYASKVQKCDDDMIIKLAKCIEKVFSACFKI